MIWETLEEVENRVRKPLPHNEVCDHLPIDNRYSSFPKNIMIRTCQMNAYDHGTSDVAKIYASSRSKKRIAFLFVKVVERRKECRPPQIGMDCVVFKGSVSLLLAESTILWPLPEIASASERD